MKELHHISSSVEGAQIGSFPILEKETSEPSIYNRDCIDYPAISVIL